MLQKGAAVSRPFWACFLVDSFVVGIHNAVIAALLCAGLTLGVCLLIQLLADLIEGLLQLFGLQLIWLAVLTVAGNLFWNCAVKKVTVNGG